LRALTVLGDVGSIALCVATFQFAVSNPSGGIVIIAFPSIHLFLREIKKHKMANAIEAYNNQMK
jgi:hypothetical protein